MTWIQLMCPRTVTPLLASMAAVSISMTVTDWLRLAVLVVGLAGSATAIYWNWRTSRAKERDILCRDCRDGIIPGRCPIPRKWRPINCPLLADEHKIMSK
jgi:hypothetical protein